MRIAWLGREAIAILGAVTGRAYAFAPAGALGVDLRDAPTLLRNPLFQHAP